MASATSERVFQALLLRKRGHSVDEIARLIKPRIRTCETLTVRTAAVVLHSGERTLTSCCLRDFRPANLPEELWPPQDVRQRVREAHEANPRTGALRALREWMDVND